MRLSVCVCVCLECGYKGKERMMGLVSGKKKKAKETIQAHQVHSIEKKVLHLYRKECRKSKEREREWNTTEAGKYTLIQPFYKHWLVYGNLY